MKQFHLNGKFGALVAVLWVLVATTACAPQEKTETIFIISTNDIHGAIENIPRLATLVVHYRAQDTASVFLVDAGDRWTGNPYVDMAVENGRRVDGKPIIDLMNALGYDLASFGNHEFDKGLPHLDRRTGEAEFPVVLANIGAWESTLSQPDPYRVLESRRGTRLAFVGLITNFINGHPDGKDEIFEDVTFPSPFDMAEVYEGILRDRADVLIALSHTGDDADSLLALRVPAYDLVIGGHTHRVIDEPLIVNGVRITQTGKSLRYAGVTAITMRGTEPVAIENHLVKLDTVAPDPVFAAMVEKYYDNPVLKEVVGSVTSDMTRAGIANLFTDVIRADMKTDFAFYHNGGIRTNDFPKGNITVGDIFGVEPFSSTAVKCHMTLDQIRGLIINKYNDTVNPKEAHRPDIHPSGMTYTIVTDEQDVAIDVTFSHRQPFQAGRKYSVAMSDYIYLTYNFDKPQAEEYSGQITDMLVSWFGSRSPVKPDNAERITIRRR